MIYKKIFDIILNNFVFVIKVQFNVNKLLIFINTGGMFMQANADMNIYSIVLLQEVEKAFSEGYEVFFLDTRNDYPICFNQRAQIIDALDLESIVYLNAQISRRVGYYAGKILPFLKGKPLGGLLVVENEGMLSDKTILSQVFKIHLADYQEIVSVISLLNKRQEGMRRKSGNEGKRQHISDMEELVILELSERANECLKKGGKVFIKGKKLDYPSCKRKNIEFVDAEKTRKIMKEGSIRAKIREFIARHIYWGVVPAWEYIPPVVVFEAEKIVGAETVRRRSFYYYKAEKKILCSVIESL